MSSSSGAARSARPRCAQRPRLARASLGPFFETAGLPGARSGVAVATDGTYIYALGGENQQGKYDTVFYARPAANGRISAWQTATLMRFRVTIDDADAEVHDGWLYLVGGTNMVGSRRIPTHRIR